MAQSRCSLAGTILELVGTGPSSLHEPVQEDDQDHLQKDCRTGSSSLQKASLRLSVQEFTKILCLPSSLQELAQEDYLGHLQKQYCQDRICSLQVAGLGGFLAFFSKIIVQSSLQEALENHFGREKIALPDHLLRNRPD